MQVAIDVAAQADMQCAARQYDPKLSALRLVQDYYAMVFLPVSKLWIPKSVRAAYSYSCSTAYHRMGDQIVLDRDVRDWVLVPLTMSIVLMMLIRQYATQVQLANSNHLLFRPLLVIFSSVLPSRRSLWAVANHSRRWT